MSQTINIKLTKVGPVAGPFVIYDQVNNIIANNVSKQSLISGVTYIVSDSVTSIKINSIGDCVFSKTNTIAPIADNYYNALIAERLITGCVWTHLNNIQLYNSFYGETRAYVIEYPFAYQYQDEILQNVKDYSKAYKYLPIPDGVFNYNTKIETNDKWFNKAILYNGQQSSGLLELVAKPLHNLKEYMTYPKFNVNSKTITYTKSDNFYQYNTFWAAQISSQAVLFNTPCTSLSYDKVINDANMDYSTRSFRKAPLRAKELKVRHILDDANDVHIVSQFILTPAQISYK
jgi:hypothetical protein